jgi:hypothetical protein
VCPGGGSAGYRDQRAGSAFTLHCELGERQWQSCKKRTKNPCGHFSNLPKSV